MSNTRFLGSKWILVGLFLIFALIQFSNIWRDYARAMLPYLFNYAPTVERSEILVVGANDARYLRFLDKYLPEDASIVGAPVRQFSSQNRLQWFLLPRGINVSCGEGLSDACLKEVANPNTVVLAIGDFPPTQDIPGKVFISYPVHSKDLRGLYVPSSLAAKLSVPDPSEFKDPQVRSPRLLLLDLLILGSLFIVGALILCWILASPSWLDYFSLSLPLAFSVLTWLIFFTSWLGIPINRTSISLAVVLLLLLSLVGNRYWNHRWFSIPSTKPNTSKVGLSGYLIKTPLILLLIALFGLAAAIAIARSYGNFSEIANWGLKGYAIAAFGTIRAGALYGGHVLSYPLNTALSIALFRIMDGDLIPGSKLIFPIMASALLIQIYTFLRRHGVASALILAGGLFLFTVPSLFSHSTQAIANLPFTCYLLMAAFWTIDGLLQNRWRWILLGGVLFASAAWTRPEGIALSLIFLFAIYTFLFIRRKTLPRKLVLVCSFVPMIFPILWILLVGSHNMSGDEIGIVMSEFLSKAARGDFILWAIAAIFNYAKGYFLAPREGAGFILPLGLLAVTIGLLLNYQRRNLAFQLTSLLTLLAALFPAGMFYLASAHWAGDFKSFLDQSFDRAYFPALVLLLVTALLLFSPVQNGLSPKMDTGEKSAESAKSDS